MGRLQSIRQSRNTVVGVCCMALFTDMLFYGIIVPVLPDYATHHFNANSTVLGAIYACYAAGLIIFTPVFAILSDKFNNRKYPMVASLVFLGISTLLYGLAADLVLIGFARFCQGVSAAGTWACALALIADVHEVSVLGGTMGLVMGVNGLGVLIGPPIGGALYQYLSYTSIFIACACLAFFDALCRAVLIDESFIIEERKRVAIINEQQYPANSDNHHKLTIWSMFLEPELMTSQFAIFVQASFFASMEPTLPLVLETETQYDLSSTGVGLFFLALVLPYMFASVPAGLLADKYPKKYIMAIGMGGMAVIGPLLTIPYDISDDKSVTYTLMLICLILIGISLGFATAPALPEIALFLQKTNNLDASAQGYAMYNIVNSGGQVVGPLVAGALYDTVGFRAQVLLFSGMIFMCSVGLVYYQYRQSRFDSTVLKIVHHQQEYQQIGDGSASDSLMENNNTDNNYNIENPSTAV